MKLTPRVKSSCSLMVHVVCRESKRCEKVIGFVTTHAEEGIGFFGFAVMVTFEIGFSDFARGVLGLSDTEKLAKIFTKTEKLEEKNVQNRKNAGSNDQNRKFLIFNPSTLDATAKYWP